eukprot:5553825-Prymnesium_polylepis.1
MAEAANADEPMAEAVQPDGVAEDAAGAAEGAAAEEEAAAEDTICTPRSVDLPGACTFHEVRLVDRRNAGERVVRWVMGCELERILYNNDAST